MAKSQAYLGMFEDEDGVRLHGGNDYAIRTAANYIGIWANATAEVVYFVTTRDANGDPLDGSKRYVIDFPKSALPGDVVNAYWSLSMVDVPGYAD